MGTTNQDGYLVQNYSYHVPQQRDTAVGSEGKRLLMNWEQGNLLLLAELQGPGMGAGVLPCQLIHSKIYFSNSLCYFKWPLPGELTTKQHSRMVKWSEMAEESFVQLKRALTSHPLLMAPDFKKSFIVHTDASETGNADALSRRDALYTFFPQPQVTEQRRGVCGIVRGCVIEGRYVPSKWLQHGDYKPRWLRGPELQLPCSSAERHSCWE
ncbi:hypothetical protein QQF64_012743 [Cirrhinus molitorella]|uniref:Reverse transcriptase/retrotransposon-derived protein RNase H-like domain-containing protein n=1 Tax=Cirrhinus molitorella TaxID=172907 RepID=A0ABR3LWC8_9TELE